MSIRNQYLLEDELCETTPPDGTDCDGTSIQVSLESVSTGTGGFFSGSASSDAPGGVDLVNYPEWFFRVEFSSDTLGPVNPTNVGTFGTWTLTDGPNAGAILAIDWSDINKPIFSQTNELPGGGIAILGGVIYRDACNNVKVARGRIGFTDDPDIPAPVAVVFWAGDASAVTVPGDGTNLVPQVGGGVGTNGFVVLDGQITEDDGATPQGPDPGAQLQIVVRDATNGRILTTAVFDYSGAIDFLADAPISEATPTYTRTDGSTTSLSWATIRQHFGAGAGVDGTGAITGNWDKLNFAVDNFLDGCFIAEPDNAVEIEFIASVNVGPTSFSPTSTVLIERAEYDEQHAQPYGVTQETQSGNIFLANTAIDQIQEIENLGGGVYCVKNVPEFTDAIEAALGGPLNCVIQEIIADTTRVVNGRNPLFVTCGSDIADIPGTGGLAVGIWNPTSGSWDVTYNQTGNTGARTMYIDTSIQINGRPIIWNDLIGLGTGFFHYTGVGEIYDRHVFAAYPFAAGNGAGRVVIDPVTNISYWWAGSAADGLQSIHTLEFTGVDPFDGNDYTAVRLGWHQRLIDVDGPLNAVSGTPGTVGFLISQMMYSGNRVNGEPEFYFTENQFNHIKRLFFNGADWEVQTLGGTGAAAVTDGDLATVAEFNFPAHLERLTDGTIAIVERLGNAVRIWDEVTGQVTTITGNNGLGLVENLYI